MKRIYIQTIGLLAVVFAVAPISAHAATASFDEDVVVTTSTKPTITGEAEDVKKLRLVVRNDDEKIVFKKDVRVNDGEWKTRVSKRLKKGDYELALYAGKSTRGEVLAASTLTIGDKKEKGVGSDTTLSVSSVPLLFGGTAMPGTSVPVAYVKVVNTSTKASAIEGFTLNQRGSAPTSVITGFATNDDKGGSRTTVNASFKGTKVYVPLAATLTPGQMRIFTIKAMVGSTAVAHLGQQLMLDVTSVESGATLRGTFPLVGTTWTLGY